MRDAKDERYDEDDDGDEDEQQRRRKRRRPQWKKKRGKAYHRRVIKFRESRVAGQGDENDDENDDRDEDKNINVDQVEEDEKEVKDTIGDQLIAW